MLGVHGAPTLSGPVSPVRCTGYADTVVRGMRGPVMMLNTASQIQYLPKNRTGGHSSQKSTLSQNLPYIVNIHLSPRHC